MGFNNQKDRTEFLTTALLSIGAEDSRGFRALVNHRTDEYKLLEKRGLIYRTTSCSPERCQYRGSHGPTPGGDCRREGWVLSLRGRLTIELLREGVPFDRAVWLAENDEHNFTESTVIHRREAQHQGNVIFGAEIREDVIRLWRKPKRSQAAAQPDVATRAVAAQGARFKHNESLVGDMVSKTSAIRSELASAVYQLREEEG